jgi:cytochrome oxidase Cu insertion factor (SCO1/SenC/PrrC family)
MGKRIPIVITLILLLGLGLSGPVIAAYNVGDHVSNFTLPNAYGNNVSLYDYQDRIVALTFWFST